MADVEKSTVCVVETLKSLPETMLTAATIQNPCNMNEIFVIGAEKMSNIYIYNRSTDTFSKNKNDDLTSILSTYPQSEIRKCYSVQCDNSNSIIVLGTFKSHCHVRNNFYTSFYSIFNSKSLTFDKVATNIKRKYIIKDTSTDAGKNININITRNGKAVYNTCALLFEESYMSQMNGTNINNIDSKINCQIATQYLPFWNEQSRFNVYKNYLIFSHELTIGIYDIKDEHNPKLIMYINVCYNFRYHGMVIIPSIASDTGNMNIVKLLAFGGYGNEFLSSFVEYKLNFDELEIESKKEKFGIATNVTVDKDKDVDINDIDKYNLDKLSNIITQTNSVELSKMLNIDQFTIEAQKKYFAVVHPDHPMRYGIFGCNLYNSRYLMIYDLYDSYGATAANTMITFDFQSKIWTIHNDIWPAKLWRKGHALIQSKYDGVFLQTMGGLDYSKHRRTASHLVIKLSLNVDWSIERLLWIAYLKNDQQSQLCPLATLPKDIILLILKFFTKRFVFS